MINKKEVVGIWIFFLVIISLSQVMAVPVIDDIFVQAGKSVYKVNETNITNTSILAMADYKIKDSKNNSFSSEITVEGNKVKMIPNAVPINRIEFNNLTYKKIIEIGIDDVPENIIKDKKFAEVYAIDPTKINFTNATVTVTATGTDLWKCKDWNFSEQKCYGNWTLLKTNLVPGQEYNFTLTPQDPGFGETIETGETADDFVLTTGDETSGSYTDTQSSDDVYHVIKEQDIPVKYLFDFYYKFTDIVIPLGYLVDSINISFEGYWTDDLENVSMYIYNWSSLSWEKLANEIYYATADYTLNNFIENASDFFNGSEIRIQFADNNQTEHDNQQEIYIDRLWIDVKTIPPEADSGVVITALLPDSALRKDGVNVLDKINKSDDVDVNLIVNNPKPINWAESNWTNNRIETGARINNVRYYFEHTDSSTTNINLTLEWFDGTSYAPVCDAVETKVEKTDSCDLSSFINSPIKANNVSLRYIINKTGGRNENTNLDFGYLLINWSAVPPSVKNITANPFVVNPYESLNITANITDENNISEATLEITYPNSTKTNYSLTGPITGGIYSYLFNNTILLGKYNITLYAYDIFNAINNTEKSYFYVNDTIKPAIILNYPENSFNTTSTMINFNWTATDNYDASLLCNLTIDGIINASNIQSQSGNSTNYSVSGFSDGTYSWNVTCWDDSDNINTSEISSFTVDTTPPLTTATAVKEDATNYTFNAWTSSSYVNVTLSCNDDSGIGCDTILYCADILNACIPNSIYSAPIQILTEGISYIRYKSNDTLGNDETAKNNTIKIDTTFPTIQFTNPTTPAGNYNQNYITSNVSASDLNLDTIKIYLYNSTGLVQSNQTSNSILFINFTALKDNTYYLNATANDTLAHTNITETRIIVLDTTPPAWSSNKTSPASGTEYSPGANYQFNITWIDAGVGLDAIQFEHNFTGAPQNTSYAGSSNNEYYLNYSGLAAGTYYWKSYANDTSGNLNSTNQFTYTVAKATSTCSLTFDKTSPQNYTTQINTSCSCTNPEASAKLYRNGTDVTATENNQLITLPAGTWNYICNVTETQNYTSASTISPFTINKADPSPYLNLSLNENESNLLITYGAISNATGLSALADNQDLIFNLYRNNTIVNSSDPASEITTLAAGSYLYVYNTTGGANYTAGSSSVRILTVNKASTYVNLSLNGNENNLNLTYPETVNATYSTNALTAAMYRDGTNVSGQNNTPITLPAGYYNYTVINPGNENYTSSSKTFFVNVTQAITNLTLSASPSWNETYGIVTNISCAADNAEVNISLYRNTTYIASSVGGTTSDIQTLAAGTYNYTCNTTGSQNYTSAHGSNILTINKAASQVNLTLNGSNTNITVDQNEPVNITTRLITPLTGYIEIYQNTILINNGTAPLTNITSFSNVGTYNITALYPETQNYTSNSSTYFISVADTTPPSVGQIQPTIADEDISINYNATISDNVGISNCVLYIDAVNNGVMSVISNTANRTVTIAQPGTYQFLANCSDAAGNYNDTSITTVAINDITAPGWNPAPINQTLEYGNLFSYDINASDSVQIDRYFINDTTNFAINTSTGLITNATGLTINQYSLTVSVNDTSNNINSSTITITVQDTTSPAWVETPANQTIEYNTSFSYDVNATDLQTIIYSVNDTTNFAINPATGTITNNTVLGLGLYSLKINAADTSNNSNTAIITINVQDTTPPVWLNNKTSPATIKFNDSAHFNITWQENVNLSGYIFSINDSGTWVNYSFIPVTGASVAASTTKSINSTRGTVIGWRYYANDTSNIWAQTPIFTITIANTAPFANNISLSSDDIQNTTTANLTALWNYFDVDNDLQTINETKWYNNNIEVFSLANKTTIGAGNTTKGQNWTFSVRAYDGYDWSSWQNSSTLTIQNTPPLLTQPLQNKTLAEDNTTSINLSEYFFDVDNDLLNWSFISQDNITISINSTTGTAYLTPDKNWNGISSIIFVASDGYDSIKSNTILLNITPVNDPPIWQFLPQNQTIQEDTNLIYDINATDIDGDQLYYFINDSAFQINTTTGSISWMPPPNWNGIKTLTLKVSDGQINRTAEIVINVTPVNDPPIINLNNTWWMEDHNYSLNLSAFMSDIDDNSMNISDETLVGEADKLNMTTTNSSIIFTPAKDWFGELNLTITVCDQQNCTTSNITKLKIISVPDIYAQTFNGTDFDNITPVIINQNYGLINTTVTLIRKRGAINFTGPINFTRDVNLDEYVNISENLISINTTALPELNKSATLILYNLTFANPKILRDGADCPSSICKKISYNDGILIFNVTSFSTYQAAETPVVAKAEEETSSSSGGGGGGAGGFAPRLASTCIENWNCTEWQECIDSIKTRKCFDINLCETYNEKPFEKENCTAENSTTKRKIDNKIIAVETPAKTSCYIPYIYILLLTIIIILFNYYTIKYKTKTKKIKTLISILFVLMLTLLSYIYIKCACLPCGLYVMILCIIVLLSILTWASLLYIRRNKKQGNVLLSHYVHRKPGYFYYVDKKGNICETKIPHKKTKEQKMKELIKQLSDAIKNKDKSLARKLYTHIEIQYHSLSEESKQKVNKKILKLHKKIIFTFRRK